MPRKSVHAHQDGKLPTSQKVIYGFPRGTTQGMALLLQTTVRFFYIEGLGLKAESMAVAIAVCKSLDFLIGFAVGYATDNLKSRWGRRKPFIAVGFPLWIAVMLAINNPPESLGRQTSNTTSLGGGVCTGPALLGNCSAMAACLSRHGAGGTTLRDYIGVDGDTGYFQQDLAAYGRTDQMCPRGCGPIRREVIGQRSTFFCPVCQR